MSYTHAQRVERKRGKRERPPASSLRVRTSQRPSHYRFRAEYLITGDDNKTKKKTRGKREKRKISVMRVENEEIINIIERVPRIKIPRAEEVDSLCSRRGTGERKQA